jgi:hypothetical protein
VSAQVQGLLLVPSSLQPVPVLTQACVAVVAVRWIGFLHQQLANGGVVLAAYSPQEFQEKGSCTPVAQPTCYVWPACAGVQVTVW